MAKICDISVIIPTLSRDAYLADTLLDLLKQKGDFSFEIIVVDQNPVPVQSRSESLYSLSKKDVVKWLSCMGRGVVYARNYAISIARGELLIFIDDDVQIRDNDFLNKHLRAHAESEPDVAAVCGRENNPGSETSVTTSLNYKREHSICDVLFFPRNYDKRTEAIVLSTCNCSVRKKIMLEVGCFDENFSGASYGDDSDLALRLIEKGYKIIYDPRPALVHLMAPMGGLRLSDRKNPFSEAQRVVSSLVFYLKHVHKNYKDLRLFYIFRYILRKSIFLKSNLKRPWKLPSIIWGLIKAFFVARGALKQGHKFSFDNGGK